MKLSGLAAKRIGLGLETRTAPFSATELAAVWKPYVEACIEAFGAERCIWGSNYPVEASLCDYGTLINAYKIAVAAYSDAEKKAIFSGNAARTYSLFQPL
jgi:predicted TIM-barrel fold metal-dependent hydrolase